MLADTLTTRATVGQGSVFEDLYRQVFPRFARYAARMNGTFDEAKDIFHDALVIYYERTIDENFSPPDAPAAYLLGIARHLWLKRMRSEQRLQPLGGTSISSIVDAESAKPGELNLLQFVEQHGRKCLELLSKFYFGKSTLKEIASWLGYRTEHSAAVQKHKCIMKIRNTIREKSIRYEDFNF